MARFEALAEEAMSGIYDTRGIDVRAAHEDAIYNIGQALGIARIRGWDADAERLAKRQARIQASFDSRYKKKRPTTP
jgi:hypothetical protein